MDDKLPYVAELYDPFANTFIPKLMNYLKGRNVALPSYRTYPERWDAVDFGSGLTPKQCIDELDALADFGDFDVCVDCVSYINNTVSHIIHAETEVEGVVYRYTYDLTLPVSETNGTHFIRVVNEDT